MATSNTVSNYATKSDLSVLEDRLVKRIEAAMQNTVQKAIDDLSEIIAQFAEHVDERFNRLEAHVERQEENFERLQNTLDAQIARLERWIEIIAQKTGIKLEY